MLTDMKKSRLVMLFFMVILATWSIEACNNGNQSKTGDSVDAAKEANDSSLAMVVNEADARFVVNIADKGLEEAEIAKLAKQKSANTVIKAFAGKVETTYAGMNAKLKTLAARKNIALPAMMGEKAQITITEQTQKKGTEFDRGLMNKIIDTHQVLTGLFEKEAKEGADADIRDFAGEMLPVVQSLLKEAKEMADKIK